MIDAGAGGERHRRADHVGLGGRGALAIFGGPRGTCYAENGRARIEVCRFGPGAALDAALARRAHRHWHRLRHGDALRLSATTALMPRRYADTLQVQSARPRDIEQEARVVGYLVRRAAAKYECPFLRPRRQAAPPARAGQQLGTAFGYDAGTEYLLADERVAAWPDVTDASAASTASPGVQARGGQLPHRARRARRLRDPGRSCPSRA